MGRDAARFFIAVVASLAAWLCCAAAGVATGDAAATGDGATDLDRLLERSRVAHGCAAFAASGKELLLEGQATANGLSGAWRLRIAADGRFAEAHATRFPTRGGFDGQSYWRVDATGLATRTVLEERDDAQLEQSIWAGTWCARKDGPAVVDRVGEEAALRIRVRDGLREGRLLLDAASALPSELVVTTYRSEQRSQFHDWRAVEGGLAVPWSVTTDDGGQIASYVVERALLVDPDPAAFAFPATRPTDATFDPALPSAVACRRAATGHLLVRVELDGADHGRWIFDSGAGGMVIDPDLAKELGLAEHGAIWIGGAGAARSVSHLYEAHALRIGPVTVQSPRLSGLELDDLSKSFGEKLAGIVGYDLLQRVVATVDMKLGRVELADPATFHRDGVTWRELTLHGHHPHVECTFGHPDEERALFRLDTGAGGVAVLFHEPFVRDSELLLGRVTTPFSGLSGVGGESKARLGQVDWFELGGAVVDDPTVIFVEEPRGALADPYSAGTIGGTLLSQSQLIFDYPHQRVGFVARDS